MTQLQEEVIMAATVEHVCLCCKQRATMTAHCDPAECRWFKCGLCGAVNDYRTVRHYGGTVTEIRVAGRLVRQDHDHAVGCDLRTAPSA